LPRLSVIITLPAPAITATTIMIAIITMVPTGAEPTVHAGYGVPGS
jgi:hypothetical protein